MITWLGLDSSLAAFGYCAMKANDATPLEPWIVDAGTWVTKPDPNKKTKAADTKRRIAQLADQLAKLLEQHKPICVFVEGMIFFPRGGLITAAQLGRVRGMVDGVCGALRVPVFEFDPKRVKSEISGGQTGASKADVAARIVRKFPALEGLDDNATDAAAVAWVGAHLSPLGRPDPELDK